MPNLFGLDIAKIVADAFADAGGVLDATLTVETPGSRTPGSLTGGVNKTSANYSGKGFIEELQTDLFPETLVALGTKQVVLLGHTFSVAPDANHIITIEGETLKVLGVVRDPAGATYICLCSG